MPEETPKPLVEQVAEELAGIDPNQLPGEIFEDQAPTEAPAEVVESTPEEVPPVEVAAATAPDNVPTETVAPTGISDELKAKAKEFGYTDDEIQTYATSEQLDAAISVQARRMSAYGQSTMTPPAPPAPTVTPAATQTTPTPTTTAPTGDIPRFELDLPKELEADYPDFAKAFRAMADFMNNQLADVHQGVVKPFRQMVSANQQQEQLSILNEYDSWFSAQPKEVQSALGGQPLSKLDLNSDAAKKHLEVIKEADLIARGYLGSRLRRPSNRSLFDMGGKIALADKLKEIVRQEEAEKIRNRRSQMTPRPGQRTAPSNGEYASEDERMLAMSGLPD